jgi:hypothetical protein
MEPTIESIIAINIPPKPMNNNKNNKIYKCSFVVHGDGENQANDSNDHGINQLIFIKISDENLSIPKLKSLIYDRNNINKENTNSLFSLKSIDFLNNNGYTVDETIIQKPIACKLFCNKVEGNVQFIYK